MKNLVLIFLAVTFCSCSTVQTQHHNENTPTVSNQNNNIDHVGYARYTTTDKQYLGCWRSAEASEVVTYELKFFQITEKTIQTSKMSSPIPFLEVQSNIHKDWFVLHTEVKKVGLQPYLNINIVSDDEMTIGELQTDNLDGEYENYWSLTREDCRKIESKFKN